MIVWMLFTNMSGDVYKHVSGDGMRWFEAGGRRFEEVNVGVNGEG